jgi:hypothetical protein
MRTKEVHHGGEPKLPVGSVHNRDKGGKLGGHFELLEGQSVNVHLDTIEIVV